MKHLAAYVLLLLGGTESPTAEQVIVFIIFFAFLVGLFDSSILCKVTEVLTTIGAEVDENKLTSLFADLEGKDIHELLAKGEKDLKSVVGVSSSSSGGGGNKISY